MANQETSHLVPAEVLIPLEPPKPTPAILKQRVLQNNIDQHFLEDFNLNVGPKPILSWCCENRGDFSNVTPQTLQLLINSGANIHQIHQEWYGWEPLHYAAFASNPEKLHQICQNITSGRINTLTVLSENALHVLLDHGTSSLSYLLCQNGKHFKTVKIINREHENVIECVKILINKGVDVHHPNFWNETPIMVAMKRRYATIVELLQKRRENSKRNFTPLPTSVFDVLKSWDFDAFVGYNLRDHLATVDGDSAANSSCTLLQYCFRRSLIFWYHDAKNESHRCEDLTQDRMIEVFCKTGCAKAILHLLDQGVDTGVTLEKFEGGTTVLRAAITKGWYPVVALILDKTEDSELDFGDITEGLTQLIKKDGFDLNNTLLVVLSRLIKCESKSDQLLATLSLLLEQGGKKINKRNQLLLLKFPKSLAWQKTNKESVLENLDPEVLKTHLDNCVTHGVINCDSITGGESLFSTVQLFELYLSSSLRDLLTHVVFKILIKRQWETPRPHWRLSPRQYFYANLAFYVFFYILLNFYILVKFNAPSSSQSLQIYVWIFWTLFVTKELLQVVSNWKLYIQEASNWLELIFTICTLLVLIFDTPWIDIVEVLTVLSSNAVLLSLLMTLPTCAKYIIILRTIVLYFRYLLFYLIQFVAFTISFYILFAQSKQIWYQELGNKFFDTVILFTGNLDYMETPWKTNTTLYHQPSYNEPFAKFIFIIFVFFLAIILQNLLLGLLVIDIGNLQKEVALSEQMKRAAFVVRLEKIFGGFLMKRLCQHFPAGDLNGDSLLVINDDDREVLTEEEKQQLDHVTKRLDEPDELKKLRNYIRRRVNERCDVRDEREIVGKLELLEEMVKELQERK